MGGMHVPMCVLEEGGTEECKVNPSLSRTLKVLSAHLNPCLYSGCDARGAGPGLLLLLFYPLS